MQRFADRHQTLREARSPAQDRLLRAVTTLHSGTVWAATRRAGRFWNFDVFQYLRDCAAAEAKARSSDVIIGPTAIIDSDQGNPELVSSHEFLAQVRANLAQWEAILSMLRAIMPKTKIRASPQQASRTTETVHNGQK
ncbi:hypothetical protein [Bradyrhizobium sp. USDA 4451]